MRDYVYGKNPVISALGKKDVLEVFLQKGFKDFKLLAEIKQGNIKTTYLSQEELNKMTNNGVHQGVVALVKPFQYSSLKEIIACSNKKERPLILILDEVNDPHNLGAIIRSCDAFSVDGVIIKNRNQVPVNMTVTKVSTGAINHVKIAMVSNLNNAVKELKDNGFWIYASDGNAKDDYSNIKYDGKVALIMGSEGNGISPLLLSNSDFIIKIPMTGHVNSLNVSVATGILLSYIRVH